MIFQLLLNVYMPIKCKVQTLIRWRLLVFFTRRTYWYSRRGWGLKVKDRNQVHQQQQTSELEEIELNGHETRSIIGRAESGIDDAIYGDFMTH